MHEQVRGDKLHKRQHRDNTVIVFKAMGGISELISIKCARAAIFARFIFYILCCIMGKSLQNAISALFFLIIVVIISRSSSTLASSCYIEHHESQSSSLQSIKIYLRHSNMISQWLCKENLNLCWNFLKLCCCSLFPSSSYLNLESYEFELKNWPK